MTREEMIEKIEGINFYKDPVEIYEVFNAVADSMEAECNTWKGHQILGEQVLHLDKHHDYLAYLLTRKFQDFGIKGVKLFIQGIDENDKVFHLDTCGDLITVPREVWEYLQEEFLEILKKETK